MPNNAYIGQKLTKLVNTNTADKINKITPSVPDNKLVRYNNVIKIAIVKRIILSIFPMFFFIKNNFKILLDDNSQLKHLLKFQYDFCSINYRYKSKKAC